MTPDEKTVLSALELLDIGTEQPIRVWAFKRILDRVEGLRNEIGLRDEAITRLEAEFDATCNAEEMRQVREDNKRLQAEVSTAALYVQEALRRQKEAEARMLVGTDHLYLKEMVDRLQAEVVNLTEQIGLRDEACTDLEAKLQAAELEVTRACDHVGCTAAIIRRDDGTRVCAAGHPSRWVERSEFDASQAEVARLTQINTETLENAITQGSALRARIAGLEAWLLRFGKHQDVCKMDHINRGDACICGLAELLGEGK